MGIFNQQSFNHPFARGIQGAPGVGFRLTSNGNFDISGKKLTNVGAPTSNTDAATKKYVDDKSASGGGGGASGPPKSSTLVIDSNIDMKDRFRILNLKSPRDADEPATKQYADSSFLDRGGDRGMIANLVMNNHKITQLGAPTANTDSATKKYVDDKAASTLTSATNPRNISMAGGFRITNLSTPVDSHEPPTKFYVDNTFLERDGSYPMTGDLKMGTHKITGLKTPTASLDAATKKYVDENIPDTSNFVKKDGSVRMTGDFDIGGYKILNIRTPTSNTEAASKKYVDDKTASAAAGVDLSDYLEKDGTVAMTGNLNMGSNRIVSLSPPTSNTDASTKKYVDDAISNNNFGNILLYLKRDGSTTMTGNLNMGNKKIVSLADPTNPSDSTTMSWVKKQIQHFDVTSSPVFTVTPAPAYTTIYLQHQSSRFVFTTSRPGLPLVSWKPIAGIYLNKIVFNFNRSINVKKISFVPSDSSKSAIDFWVSATHTGIWSLNIHRTWTYEMSGVFLDYITDANSNNTPITANIYTGKPSAATRNFSKITFSVPTEFTNSITATTPTTSSQVATKAYVDKTVSGPAHYRNVFDYLMQSASQWTDEITTRTSFVIKRIGDLSPNSGNFHSYNHRVIYLGLKKYSGGYKFKMGANFYSLPVGDYTICFDLLNTDYTLWHKTQIEIDHRTSTGLTFLSESVKKHTYSYYYPTNNLNYMYYHRVIVSFTKSNAGRSFFHITVNIPSNGNDMDSYPSEFTKFYLIVYGISGAHGNVDPDRSFDYHTGFDVKSNEVVFNVPINANNKEIKNIAVSNNASSAATVSQVVSFKNFLLPIPFYDTIFDEIWVFDKVENYSLVGATGFANFNRLKSLKSNKLLTFPSKGTNKFNINGIFIEGNDLLQIPLPTNTKNINIFIVFKFYSNRDFTIIRKDSVSNKQLFNVSFTANNQILTINSSRQSSRQKPTNFNGKKVVLNIRQNETTYLKLYYHTYPTITVIGYDRINSPSQIITFNSNFAEVSKVMYTTNTNLNFSKVLLQELLI